MNDHECKIFFSFKTVQCISHYFKGVLKTPFNKIIWVTFGFHRAGSHHALCFPLCESIENCIICFPFHRGSLKVDTAGSEDAYFVAPDKYLGDQRHAYSLALSFYLQQDDASSPAASSKGDVILEGKWFDQPLVTSLDTPPPGGNNFNKYEVILKTK